MRDDSRSKPADKKRKKKKEKIIKTTKLKKKTAPLGATKSHKSNDQHGENRLQAVYLLNPRGLFNIFITRTSPHSSAAADLGITREDETK